MPPQRRRVVTHQNTNIPKTPDTPASPKISRDVTSPLSPISPWPPLLSEEPELTSPTAQSTTNNHPQSTATTQVDELPTAKEVYGSIAVLGTGLGYIIYLFWAFLPSSTLDRFGWTWYPARDWALVVPCWLMMLVLTAYWCYAALTIYLTPSFDEMTIITDTSALAAPAGHHSTWTAFNGNAMPPAVDIPIDQVNQRFYPHRPRPE